MMPFTKYFAHELSEKHRRTLAVDMGFGPLSLLFLETAGPLLLAAREWNQGRLTTLLSPAAEGPLAEGARLRRDYCGHPLNVEAASAQRSSLWEMILPYPFSLLGGYFEGRAAGLSLSPASVYEGLHLVWESFQQLEAALCAVEVGCLFIKSETSQTCLLFHSVRGKLLRVSVATDLVFWGQAFCEGRFEKAWLRECFGTSAGFFLFPSEGDRPLDLPELALKTQAVARSGIIYKLPSPLPISVPGLSTP